MEPHRRRLCALLLALPASSLGTDGGALPPREIAWHVEAGADEGGDGSAARPFRHPAEAVAALRAQRRRERADGTAPAPLTIVLGEGAWELGASLRFDPECSGKPTAPTTLRGRGRGTRLFGGRVLPASSFRAVRDERILGRLPGTEARAYVRAVDLGALGIETVGAIAPRGMGRTVEPAPSELFLDGRPLVRARWPNEGFATVGEVVDPGSVPRQRADDVPGAERETGPARGGVFRFETDRLERWATAPDAWMFGYWHWDWADELLPVARIDPDAGDVHLALPHRYGLRDGARFRITSLLEELDDPGEYHVDAEARVLYVWPPDDAMPGEYVLSLLPEPLILLDGCRHFVVRDLSLEAARGMAVQVSGGEHVLVEDGLVRNSGTYGIEISGRGQTVRLCELTRLGAAGVVLRGGERATLTPGGNRVLDCEIHDFGRTWRTYQPAISLSGVGNVVRHNHLYDAPHSAIIFGGNDHRIEGNQIHDVLLETGDCGAIYTGRDWTTHGNVFVRTPFGHVEDRDAVRVADNHVTDETIALFARAPGPDDRAFRFAAAEFTPPGVEDFPPIPVESIGVRAR